MRERVYRRVKASVEQRETRNEKQTLALRLQVAGFAAGLAVVLAVVAEADAVPALAQNAEAVALAASLVLIALRADIGHVARVARLGAGAQVTVVTVRNVALTPPTLGGKLSRFANSASSLRRSPLVCGRGQPDPAKNSA